MKTGSMILPVLLVILLVLSPFSPYAQEDTDRQGRRAFRERGQFDPSQMRQMMVNQMKQQLEVTDEEWTVIEPLVVNVMEKQAEARIGQALRNFMRPPGPAPDAPEGGRAPRGAFGMGQPSPEAEALMQSVENQDSSSETIKANLEKYRASRNRAEEELKKAREELRSVLTLRQEARLVLMGILD